MKLDSITGYLNRDIAIINPDMFVVEATALLTQKRMMGGPVVDDNGQLVGWISEQECLKVLLQVVYHNERVAKVKDIMRTDVLSVYEDDDALALAQQMLGEKPKNYPVTDKKGKVKGLITRRDILLILDKKLREISTNTNRAYL